jgi:hypothetical protein
MAALVLGLLIASANNSYETQAGQVRRLAANIILLDRLLAHYGPEARTARELMRRAVDLLVDRIWREPDPEARYETSAARGDVPHLKTCVSASLLKSALTVQPEDFLAKIIFLSVRRFLRGHRRSSGNHIASSSECRSDLRNVRSECPNPFPVLRCLASPQSS